MTHSTLWEGLVNAMEKNPKRENTVKVGKDYTTEEAIIVTEKAMNTIKPKTINAAGEK